MNADEATAKAVDASFRAVFKRQVYGVAHRFTERFIRGADERHLLLGWAHMKAVIGHP